MAEPSPSPDSPTVLAAFSAPPSADPDPSPAEDSDHGMGDYRRLQHRLLIATAVATALAVPFAALVGGRPCAFSLLLGGLAGLLYLWLLARSVSRLGGDRKSVGKVQLLVPVVLVLATTRIPQLQILPALLGFLLYKPALIVQMVLEG